MMRTYELDVYPLYSDSDELSEVRVSIDANGPASRNSQAIYVPAALVLDLAESLRNVAVGEGMQATYSLAEIRNGTGFPRGVRFVAVTGKDENR